MMVTLAKIIMVVYGLSMSVGANQHRWKVNPVILPENSSSACSLQQQKQGLKAIEARVTASLSNVGRLQQCGDGPWYKIAFLNMSDPAQSCPSNWREYRTTRVRACGRFAMGCTGNFYPTGRMYSKVCGRVIGYQVASPDAFDTRPARNLNDVYADGVSITYGWPRMHIWTYSAGVTEGTHQFPRADCPCAVLSSSERNAAPAFIGNNYYCESGNRITAQFDFAGHLYDSDPIWDGRACEHQCCVGKSPPWFSVALSSPTADDIEVRICGDQTVCDEDTPITLMELYVQ